MTAPLPSRAAPDRYARFLDIDVEGNMACVLAHLRRHIGGTAPENRFWARFAHVSYTGSH